MHQYRLLRDNKESGPYSAADLEAMGLKPYDLIWQEGKSAAWRYPGELDELKPFSPPVEEQPFDRFYRKVEKREIDQPLPAQSAFAPKPAVADEKQIRKGHIVVTMPGSMAKERPSVQSKPQPTYIRPNDMTPQDTTPLFPDRAELVAQGRTPGPYPSPMVRSYKWITIAASFLLVATLTMLILNYQAQNKKITQLRDIVTQMQQNPPAPPANGLNRQVVHYADEQQAGLLIKPDTTSVSPIEELTVKKEQAVKPAKPIVKKQVLAAVPKADSPLIIQEPIDKPLIEPQDGKRVAVKRDADEKNIMQLVKVSTNDYKTGLLGGINNLKLTLFNKSLVTLKRVEVQVDYLGPESRVVKSQTVFFDNVAPGGDLLLDVPKSGRGVKVNCTVKKIST